MFHVGNNATMDQEQFGDFRSCLGIFNNSTTLPNNRKRIKNRKENLPGACNPAHLPAQPSAAPASCLPGQAGRQVLDGEHRMGATHLLAASPLHSPG